MAQLLQFFMDPDDELAFLRFLAKFDLELYPLRIPPDWAPVKVDERALGQLPEDTAYLAAPAIGPIVVDKVKKGPDKGFWHVDELRSPVIYFERSRLNEDGELTSGRLWAQTSITEQTGRRSPAPDRFRRLFDDIELWVKKTYRKANAKAFWIGPRAARRAKEGLVLRDSEHRGGTVSVYGS